LAVAHGYWYTLVAAGQSAPTAGRSVLLLPQRIAHLLRPISKHALGNGDAHLLRVVRIERAPARD
jgi:hypothetical protein